METPHEYDFRTLPQRMGRSSFGIGFSEVTDVETCGPGTFVAWAILGSAVVGAFMAWRAIASHRTIARKRAAHDLVLTLWQPDILEHEQKFTSWADTYRQNRVPLPLDLDAIPEIEEIVRFLNYYELMSVAILQHVVDESVLMDALGDKVVKYYAAARPIITTIRTVEEDEEFFEHFETVAKRWDRALEPGRLT